ncbi:unnamed protein product [Fraxinus pennsylvanica]|uniref:Uncharacterized protein n=1 Tax=Fraxinus pennsylvanica TaxID=56036 RepID=A0AAD1ZUR5_9LAMI|nr:unnamed protein product [Fraxinus pennsylvanica]
MYNNYCDNWERLVGAVFDREKLKKLALAPSRESSSSSISWLGSPIHEQILQLEGFNSLNTVNEPDWERLLPSDYLDLISRSVNRVAYATKKDLYSSLCEFPILLDGGKMLEIRGKIDTKMLSPKTQYVVYLVYRLAQNFYGLGLANATIKFLIREDDAEAEKGATTL